MAAQDRSKSAALRKNENCPLEKEINILLLGQTGVGKTTFINAFTNYLVYDTLEEAMNGEMQVPIPSSFSFTDPETFEQKLITVDGNEKNREKVNENGQSGTEQCRSFVFPMGKQRNLRFIDTPGMGDTRGSEQDNKNLFEILTYISHYEHLNGICIFLKPNEERLTIAFRLCIKQILHYLHKDASENIIFIFTNARSTFFTPGSSKNLLRMLLKEHRDNNQIEVPFTRENTFLLDNEPFQCLVLHKNGIPINNEQMESYRKSWDHNVKEYQRLIDYISKRSLHALADTLSLNEAEQLIRKFPRPIAETFRLIQQNIQLAKESKKELLKNKRNTSYKLSEYAVQIVILQRPKLVCVNAKCSRIVDVNGMTRIIHEECYERSYLNGVIQDAISDPRIAQCKVIDNKTDKCTKCGCSWEYHMNITYEYHTHLSNRDITDSNNGNTDNQSLISFIDRRIKNLEDEQTTIEDVYEKLLKFLHTNAIYPIKNHILDYLQLFSLEEQLKSKDGAENDDVLTSLVAIKTKYDNIMDLNKNQSENEKDSVNMLANEAVFEQAGKLYRLPINGQKIREQIDALKNIERKVVRRTEKSVELPEKALESKLMHTLENIALSTKGDRY